MKTLLVLRHAKSSWESPDEDHERPLLKRGKRAAKRVGKELRKRELRPSLILCSTAKRARSTAKRAAKAGRFTGQTVETRELYMTGVDRQLPLLAAVDDQHECIMVVGHNPDSEALVSALTGKQVPLPTATLACLDLPIDSWSAIAESQGSLRFVVTP